MNTRIIILLFAVFLLLTSCITGITDEEDKGLPSPCTHYLSVEE